MSFSVFCSPFHGDVGAQDKVRAPQEQNPSKAKHSPMDLLSKTRAKVCERKAESDELCAYEKLESIFFYFFTCSFLFLFHSSAIMKRKRNATKEKENSGLIMCKYLYPALKINSHLNTSKLL